MTVSISSPDVIITDRNADWCGFLKRYYLKDLDKISREYPHNKTLHIKYPDIVSYGPLGLQLADELIESPEKTLKDIADSIRTNRLVRYRAGKQEPEINVRIIMITDRLDIRKIRNNHIGRFVSISGRILKASEVRPRIITAVYRCPAGHRTTKNQTFGKLVPPDSCQTDGCTYKRLEFIHRFSTFIDTQRLRIQEIPEGLFGGDSPLSIDIDCIDNDVCNIVRPGDRAIVNGILRRFQRGDTTTFDIYLEANSIEVPDKEFGEEEITEDDLNQIIRLSQCPDIFLRIAYSIAPSLYGLEDVKKGIALQLFGGIPKENKDGTRLRGDIHVLLIGDPGIAKSQLLRWVSKVVPRGIYVSGGSTTSAGLTLTAVKDPFDGRWNLEAGALVLADMGVACVDEMDKMDPKERGALHEAMEQQAISAAKAGITATMNCRCALFGATNPKYGRFDEYAPLTEQINMPPSLLSRFDLIYLLLDKPCTERDTFLAEFICKIHQIGEKALKIKKKNRSHKHEPETDESYIDPRLLRKYIIYAKQNCIPVLSDEANKQIVTFFSTIRSQAGEDKAVPITARQVEAIIRLAEAAARIELSEVITERHAKMVINLVSICLREVAYNPATGIFDSDAIETGMSKETRDLSIAIERCIKSLGEGKAVERDKIISALLQQNKKWSADVIEKRIQGLLNIGILTEPRHNLFKVV